MLLLTVYLLTVAAPVAHAFSCPCLHAGHFHPAHLCNIEVEACSDAAHAQIDSRSCCGCNHSVSLELYTSARGEARESVRPALSLLAVVPAAESLMMEPDYVNGEPIIDRPEHCGCNVCQAHFSLRAPPVLA